MESPIPENPFAKDAGSAVLKILLFGFIDWYEGGLTRNEQKELDAAADDLLVNGGGFLLTEALKPQPVPLRIVRPIGPPIPALPRGRQHYRVVVHHRSSV